MVLPTSVTVPGALLDVLVRDHGIGELPVVLAGQTRWYPSVARTRIAAAVRDECARVGWVNRQGEVKPDVLAALRILCRPAVAYFGWINTGGSTIGVLSAAIGKQAVLAIRSGDEVSLAPGRWNHLAEALVAQTPPVPQGKGTSLRVRVAEVAQVDDGGATLSRSRVARHRADSAVLAVKRLTALPELGTGELHVAVRDDLGRVRTPPHPVRYTDTPEGRFLVLIDTDEHDEAHALVAPADRAALVDRLRRSHRSLAG